MSPAPKGNLKDFEFENGPDNSEIIQADWCHDKTEIVWKNVIFHCVLSNFVRPLEKIITICWTLSSTPEPLFPSGPQQSQLILAIFLGHATKRKFVETSKRILSFYTISYYEKMTYKSYTFLFLSDPGVIIVYPCQSLSLHRSIM